MRILDGDRSLEATAAPGTSVVVGGYLGEPMLRIGAGGVFANAASPTAQADRIVGSGTGWRRVASGRTYAWHEHRLAPGGARGVFRIPVRVDGRSAAITGTFVRVPRPALWPWLGAALLGAGAVALAARRAALRVPLTTSLGVASGLAAAAATVAFAVRDRPSGVVAWLPVAATAAVAAVLGATLLRLHGRRRGRAAGVVGAVAAAATIASLPVFWHGVVISALPAGTARGACLLALVAGAAAAALSLLPELDG